MCSIDSIRFADLLNALEVAHSRFLASDFDALTGPERLALFEDYSFLMGQVDALRYELATPFVNPTRRRA